MGASKAQRAQTAARRTQAIQLRLAGMDWQTIADRLHYASRGAAQTDVDRALKQFLAEEKSGADELRQVENLRLDRLMAAMWSPALQGSVKAADSCLRIIDRRIRLNGLDVRAASESDPAAALSMVGALMAAISASVPDDPDGDVDGPAA